MPFVSFGGAVQNRVDPGEELVGWSGTDFVTVTANASANTKGSYATLGTASGALWKGVTLLVCNASSASVNFAIDVSVDGGTSDVVKNIVVRAATGNSVHQIALPLSVQTSTTASAVQARCQASAGSATIKMAVIGHLNTDGQARPLWSNMAADSFDATATNVDNSTITVGTGAGAYVTIANTSQACGAIMPVIQSNTSATALAGVKFSTDATDTGKFATRHGSFSSVAPTWTAANYGPLIEHPLGSGVTISAAADAATAFGTIRAGFYIFY